MGASSATQVQVQGSDLPPLLASFAVVLLRDTGSPSADAVAGIGVVVVVGAGAVVGASQTDETGAILAFVGALLVALIAAVTADRRQRAQLAAETRRLDQQLDHQRQLVDLAHLREFFDSAAAALERLYELEGRLWAFRTDDEPGDRDEGLALTDNIRKALGEVVVWARRMDLRFAYNHPVPLTYWTAVREFNKVVDETIGDLAQLSQKDLDTHDSRASAAVGKFALFALAARSVIGSGEGVDDEALRALRLRVGDTQTEAA